MCFLPKLNPIQRNVQTISDFGGLNERASIADNEFSDCYNISPEEPPALGVRDGYEHYLSGQEPTGKIRARAKKNVMITEKQSFVDFKSKAEYHCYVQHSDVWVEDIFETRYSLPIDFKIIDFDFWGDKLAILCEEHKDNISTEVMQPYVQVFNISPGDHAGIENGPEKYELSTLLKDKWDLLGGIISFGSRMILICGQAIYISYFNDLSKWTVFNEEGQYSAEAAEVHEILDDGYFTAVINFRDYPIFFKRNSMYILYGEYTPFSPSRIDNIGSGFPATVSICNGALYFLSHIGVMEYTGGVPQLISQNLNISGNPLNSFDEHTACADDRYYYIDDYIFDTYTRTWSKQEISSQEDDPIYQKTYQLYPQCRFGGQIYVNERIWRTGGGESPTETLDMYRVSDAAPAGWSFTTKQFHEYEAGKKLVSRLAIGFENRSATEMKIEVSIDKRTFQTVYTWDGTADFAKEVPVILPYCDYFQIRVSGKGKMIIHYIKRFYRVLGV